MKYVMGILVMVVAFFVFVSPVGAAVCDYTIGLSTTTADGAALGEIGGKRVCIAAGNRGSLTIKNYKGTATNPVLFVNEGGIVKVSGNMSVWGNTFIRISGGDVPGVYGIEVNGSTGTGVRVAGGSSDIEIDHIKIANSTDIGLDAKTDYSDGDKRIVDANGNGSIRDEFTQRNTMIRDNYFLNNGRESIYVGSSEYSTGADPVLKGVRIYNNRIEKSGWDGIQVGSAVEGVEIYGNNILDTGWSTNSDPGNNRTGMQINPGTTAKIFNNQIRNTARRGIYLTGDGPISVYNNLIVNTGTSVAEDAIKWNGGNGGVYNNTLVKGTRYGISVAGNATGKVANNLVVGFASTPIVVGVATSEFNLTNLTETTAKFVNPTALDYHLMSDSPAKDAGGGTMYAATDIDGEARPQGTKVDVGYDEYISGVVIPTIGPTPTQSEKQLLFSYGTSPVVGADVNNDGKVNTFDFVIKFIASIVPTVTPVPVVTVTFTPIPTPTLPVPVSGSNPVIMTNNTELSIIKTKALAGVQPWKGAYDKLISSANANLNINNPSVTDNGGGLSHGPNYYATDAPYLTDGVLDPNANREDYSAARKSNYAIRDLAIAYKLTGDTRYADKAVLLIKTWATDPNKYMFPSIINYGPVTSGHNANERIEHYITLPALLYGADIIWDYPGFSNTDKSALRTWVTSLATSARTQPVESNNIGTWHVTLAAAAGAYLQDQATLDFAFNKFREIIPSQINSKGEMVKELGRTNSLSYSLYSLNAFMQIAEIARRQGVNLYDYGGHLKRALDFHAPYLVGGNWTNWPYPQKDAFTGQYVSNASVYEFAYSYWQLPSYLAVLSQWGRPSIDSYAVGNATILNGNRFELVGGVVIPTPTPTVILATTPTPTPSPVAAGFLTTAQHLSPILLHGKRSDSFKDSLRINPPSQTTIDHLKYMGRTFDLVTQVTGMWDSGGIRQFGEWNYPYVRGENSDVILSEYANPRNWAGNMFSLSEVREEWFLHYPANDIRPESRLLSPWGTPIADLNAYNEWVFDMGHPGFQDFFAAKTVNALNKGLDGLWMDNAGLVSETSVRQFRRFSDPNFAYVTPQNPRTGVAYTLAQAQQEPVDMSAKVKAAVLAAFPNGKSKNGMPITMYVNAGSSISGLEWQIAQNYGSVLVEGNGWFSPKRLGDYTQSLWMTQIDNVREAMRLGLPLVMLGKPWEDVTNVWPGESRLMFNYASALLGAGNSYDRFYLRHNFNTQYYSWGGFNVDIGRAVGDYYKWPGTNNVYARNYDKAIVLVNPSNTAETVNTGITYSPFVDFSDKNGNDVMDWRGLGASTAVPVVVKGYEAQILVK